MAELYAHPRQPDYDSWPSDPDNPIFERKKARLDGIERDWNGYSMDDTDFQYLLAKARHFWQLFHFTANYRLELETELLAKDLEIEDLNRQLRNARGEW